MRCNLPHCSLPERGATKFTATLHACSRIPAMHAALLPSDNDGRKWQVYGAERKS